MEGKTLLIAGATGLVGRHALRLALADSRVARVVAPTRRPLAPHPKLLNPIEDFAHLPPLAPWWTVDGVVCALGTTMAKAGSRAAFEAVDYEMPLAVARLALRQGAQAFALNSALGADPQSRVFYSRVKGELEQSLRHMKNPAYASLTFVRPGLIGGERTEQRRDDADEEESAPDRAAQPACCEHAWASASFTRSAFFAMYSFECLTSMRFAWKVSPTRRPCATTGMHSWKMPPGSPS